MPDSISTNSFEARMELYSGVSRIFNDLIFENSESSTELSDAEEMLRGTNLESAHTLRDGQYRFCPTPAPCTDSFRILVADDVHEGS